MKKNRRILKRIAAQPSQADLPPPSGPAFSEPS
eukprot:CAMPEP_0175770898 /NCGR_PEP_ID=MMETSP0097-20121207/71746_1 /TAXON_ID=311494 /ORGANISM="Alexandrium monilatum, Strain CCMP3105" /LENGTH=32 /DNA_ID= /DNA_START= /DNA_END= /DNA_ORIENTATION=